MSHSEGQSIDRRPKKSSRILGIVVWILVIGLMPMSCAWILGKQFYAFDIIASEQPLIGSLTAIFMLLALMLRRWRAGLVLLLLVAISFYPILLHRNLMLPHVNPQHKPEGTIRVVSMNIYPKNEQWEQALQELFTYDADLIVLLEVSPELSRSIKNHGYLDSSSYPYWALRPWIDKISSPCYLISRYPIEELPAPIDPSYPDLQLFRRLKLPTGDVAIGLVHPLSPRTPRRWSEGNLMIESQARAALMIDEKFGLPMIIGADLNAGPAQQRARALRNAGLSMSKPMLRIAGSFPNHASLPSIMMVQLDDVWTLGDIRPVAWDTLDIIGSDHRAVIVDLKIDE